MWIFSSPTTEAKLTAALKQKRTDTQEKMFNHVQALATAKIRELDEFLQFDVTVQVEEIKGRVGGIELAHIL